MVRNDGRFFKSFPRVSEVCAIIFALYFLIHRSLSKGDLVCKKFKNVESIILNQIICKYRMGRILLKTFY